MKIRTDDKVKIIAGKDKGKVGKVIKIYPEKSKILVEGVNMVKKHIKPGTVPGNEGGIVHIEKPIDVSNVMYFDEKSKNVSRLGYVIEDGKKFRVLKKTGIVLKK